jgi:hypothetical protein
MMMKADYTKTDLFFRHYEWDLDRSKDAEEYDLDFETLDILQGYEVLMFARQFLNSYVPAHTISDLHALEYMFINHLPHNLISKHDIAQWLLNNLYNTAPAQDLQLQSA